MKTATRCAAPRIGYLLAAAMAGQRYDEACAMWRQLDEAAQVEVIVALGAQARIAVHEAGVPLQVDFSQLADSRCTAAFTTALAAFEGTPWQPPQCAHCRELAASALAEVQFKAGMAAGMPPSYIDLVCRGKAVDAAAAVDGAA